MSATANLTGINGDLLLEIPRGNVACVTHINKYGRSTNVDLNTATDIWDGANAIDGVDVWVAPTQARIHTIASDNEQDTTGGTGANSVKIYYLPDWDTPEAIETVTGNLNAGIAMNNSAVIIHRIKVVPQASSTSVNAGVITATAAVDGTVTAQIGAGKGQTQMAIYGIPSGRVAYMPKYYGCAIEALANLCVALTLLVNPAPDVSLFTFLTKHTTGIVTRGASWLPQEFKPYYRIPGPAIIKMQGSSSANNTDVSAGFDLILVDV